MYVHIHTYIYIVILRALHRQCREVYGHLMRVPTKVDGHSGRIVSCSGHSLEELAELGATSLRAGGVVATPTDTIYGLAASVQNDK